MNGQDYVRALQNPAAVFATPDDVLRQEGLSRGQRIAILRRWETDQRNLSMSVEEGMVAGLLENGRDADATVPGVELAAVLGALEQLHARDVGEAGSAAKAGGVSY